MGCCSGICKSLMILWSVIAMLYGIALVAFMAYRLDDHGKGESNPSAYFDLLKQANGTGLYETLSIIDLNKYTWYAALGLGALMFIATLIHMISTCRKSKCLLGLGTLLMILILGASVAGLVFRFEAVQSINDNLQTSLNETIINQYGHPDFDPITDSWNLFGDKGGCCGVNSSQDFLLANNWNGELKASVPPCGFSLETGCLESVRDFYIVIDDIWLTTVIAVMILLLIIVLIHTLCVCNYGFGKDNSRSRSGHDSYHLVERKK